MRSRSHGVYVISVAAELAGMHPQTLRIYERRGLVQPQRTQGGNRRYSDLDIERLRRIQDLAADGMNLEGIRRVMELEAEVERLRAENDELRQRMAMVEADAQRRSPRRDLVPLRQTVAIFGGPRLGDPRR
jgi:MerR family transcriptional regulator/heat shock protein HspR